MIKYRDVCLSSLRTNVVDLKDHLDELSGEDNLLFLRVQRFDHVMMLHVNVAGHHAVNAERRRFVRDVTRLQFRECLNRQQAAVLS